MNTMPRKPLYKLNPIVPNETIGDRLARIRKSRGLTQIEISQRVGISQALYSSYERARLRLSAEMLAQIAIVLNVSSDEILGIAKPSTAGKADRRLMRMSRKIAALAQSQRKTLFTNIDLFLEGAMARLSGHHQERNDQAKAD